MNGCFIDVEKIKSANDLGKMAVNVDKHQINELTEDIVNDLLKNAFKQEPVNIENDKK